MRKLNITSEMQWYRVGGDNPLFASIPVYCTERTSYQLQTLAMIADLSAGSMVQEELAMLYDQVDDWEEADMMDFCDRFAEFLPAGEYEPLYW